MLLAASGKSQPGFLGLGVLAHSDSGLILAENEVLILNFSFVGGK